MVRRDPACERRAPVAPERLVSPQLRPDPLREAYLRRRDDLRRLLVARLRDPVEAEDLLQDLYLKLFLFRDPRSLADPDAYLFRIAYNLAADRRRGTDRRRIREDRWVRETCTGAEGVQLAGEPPLDAALESRQELRRLLAAVDRLPSRAREVFRLHKLQERSYAEIARKLNISVSAVEKHMSRALADLARAGGR